MHSCLEASMINPSHKQLKLLTVNEYQSLSLTVIAILKIRRCHDTFSRHCVYIYLLRNKPHIFATHFTNIISIERRLYSQHSHNHNNRPIHLFGTPDDGRSIIGGFILVFYSHYIPLTLCIHLHSRYALYTFSLDISSQRFQNSRIIVRIFDDQRK